MTQPAALIVIGNHENDSNPLLDEQQQTWLKLDFDKLEYETTIIKATDSNQLASWINDIPTRAHNVVLFFCHGGDDGLYETVREDSGVFFDKQSILDLLQHEKLTVFLFCCNSCKFIYKNLANIRAVCIGPLGVSNGLVCVTTLSNLLETDKKFEFEKPTLNQELYGKCGGDLDEYMKRSKLQNCLSKGLTVSACKEKLKNLKITHHSKFIDYNSQKLTQLLACFTQETISNIISIFKENNYNEIAKALQRSTVRAEILLQCKTHTMFMGDRMKQILNGNWSDEVESMLFEEFAMNTYGINVVASIPVLANNVQDSEIVVYGMGETL